MAILTAEGFEETEFFAPYCSFFEAGYAVDVLTPPGTSPVAGAKGIPLKTRIKRIADGN